MLQGKRASKARFRRRTFHEPNLIRIKADPNYLDRRIDSDAHLHQPNSIQNELRKMLISVPLN